MKTNLIINARLFIWCSLLFSCNSFSVHVSLIRKSHYSGHFLENERVRINEAWLLFFLKCSWNMLANYHQHYICNFRLENGRRVSWPRSRALDREADTETYKDRMHHAHTHTAFVSISNLDTVQTQRENYTCEMFNFVLDRMWYACSFLVDYFAACT